MSTQNSTPITSTQNSSANCSFQDMFSTSDVFENISQDSEYEHLRVIFEDVLCTVSFADVEENIYRDELPKLKNACFEVTSKIKETLQNDDTTTVLEDIKLLLQRYISLLNFAHEAIKYISNKIQFDQVQSLPHFIIEILTHTFEHCKDSNSIYGAHFVTLSYLLTEIFKKANEVQNSFLTFINSILLFDLRRENQLQVFIKVLEGFMSIGKIVSALDIKTTAEIWKAYVLLSQTHNEFLKTSLNIEPALVYLSSDIINSIESVMKMCDWKSTEKQLKITSFNLKIIIKLCGLYEDNLGESYGKLFELLIVLNKYSVPFLQMHKYNSKFTESMQVYITVASEPLLSCLISDRQFVQHFFKSMKVYYEKDDTRLAAVFLLISLVKKNLNCDSAVRNQWLIPDRDFNLISVAFSVLDQLHAELSFDLPILLPSINGQPSRIISLYEFYLIYITALILNVNDKQFQLVQKILLEAVLQSEKWKAVFAIDCWCILARYRSEEVCFRQLQFLISAFKMLKESRRLEVKFLGNLIHRLYSFLTKKHKLELFQQFPSTENQQLWFEIGLNKIPVVSNTDEILYGAVNKINIFFNTPNAATYKLMVTDLRLVSTCTFLLTNKVAEKNLAQVITKLWILSTDMCICQKEWFSNFNRIRTILTARLISYFSTADLLQILKSVLEQISSSTRNKYSSCIILNSLAKEFIKLSPEQKKICDTISRLFRALLKDTNPLIRQKALESFSYFAYHTKHESILADVVENDENLQEIISNYLQRITPNSGNGVEYFRAQNRVEIKHTCLEEIPVPQQKKKKISGDVNVPVLVQRLKFDCETLVEFFENETVSEEVFSDVSGVVNKLQILLSKK